MCRGLGALGRGWAEGGCGGSGAGGEGALAGLWGKCMSPWGGGGVPQLMGSLTP